LGSIRWFAVVALKAPAARGLTEFFESKKDPLMANTSSAKKAARQMIRRTEVNKARRSRVKTDVRTVEEAIASGDHAKAAAALQAVQPVLMRTAQKGLMHKKTASRKISRLSKRIKTLAG
jgi:small subunit ribosomal protein S20